jgi:hypothetical protein
MKQKGLFDTDLTEEEINDMLNEAWYDDKGKKKEVKCQCGAEKVYGKNATHSSWCVKYKPYK